MVEQPVSPAKLIAVIVGASEFPHHNELKHRRGHRSFLNSARAFKDYLRCQLQLPPDNILDLFDQDQPQDAVIQAMESFLKDVKRRDQQQRPTDLILYYVGHGLLADETLFCLALRNSRPINTTGNSLSLKTIKEVFHKCASGMRRYFILDCCYAQRAVAHLMSESDFLVRQFEDVFPKEGTALLCAAATNQPAIAGSDDQELTHFSDALVTALIEGDKTVHQTYLSLRDVWQRMQDLVKSADSTITPLPQIHAPQQDEGDVAKVLLFPNRAHVETPVAQSPHSIDELTSRLLAAYHENVRQEWSNRWSRVINDVEASE